MNYMRLYESMAPDLRKAHIHEQNVFAKKMDPQKL